MRRYITYILFVLICSNCEWNIEAPEPIRSTWALGVTSQEPLNICTYACNRYGTVELDLCDLVKVGQKLNRALSISGGYRVPNDTITPEYFKAFMDTVYAFILEGSDTLCYQGDLLDLNNYYLRDEISVYENGTQEYNFRLEVVHLDFFSLISGKSGTFVEQSKRYPNAAI